MNDYRKMVVTSRKWLISEGIGTRHCSTGRAFGPPAHVSLQWGATTMGTRPREVFACLVLLAAAAAPRAEGGSDRTVEQ